MQFLDFILKHYVLSALFLVAFIWLIIEEARHQGSGNRLTPQKSIDLINREHALVMDIRDATAFASGHITRSINVPGGAVEAQRNKLQQYKDKPLILVCATGQTSPKVMRQLHALGYQKVYFLAGGIAAWKNANLPLVKKQ